MEKLILLIDDDEEEYHILTTAIELLKMDITCKWFNNADDAYLYLQQIVPDFIFVDLNMPRINGLTCIETIRTMKKIQEVPVVLYSTTINDEINKKALEIGSTYTIRKTASFQELTNKLSLLFYEKVTLRGNE